MAAALTEAMARRLAEHGSWMEAAPLAEGLSGDPAQLRQALKDLVAEGVAEFRKGVGWRLYASALARGALQMLLRDGSKVAAKAEQVGEEWRVGVAYRGAAGGAGPAGALLGVVLFELAMPMPAKGPDFAKQHAAQAQAVLEFLNAKGVEGGTSGV